MKTIFHAVLFAIAVAAPATTVLGAASSLPKATAKVEFLEPESFTDFKMDWFVDRDDQVYLEKLLTAHISTDAARFLPAGSQVLLRFRDIDMAGHIDPWRGTGIANARILRDSYPPRLKIEYSVTDADGTVLASGETVLTDLAYQMRLRPVTLGPTDIEAELVGDFLHKLGDTLRKAGA